MRRALLAEQAVAGTGRLPRLEVEVEMILMFGV
jgi:hypothetical protein